jgi:hypothetical protein
MSQPTLSPEQQAASDDGSLLLLDRELDHLQNTKASLISQLEDVEKKLEENRMARMTLEAAGESKPEEMDGPAIAEYSWPPENKAPQEGYFGPARTSYDLNLAAGMDFKDTITVKVGSEEVFAIFKLPAEVLVASSGYFKGATRPDWFDKAVPARTVKLPDVNPGVFDLFARWLVKNGEILTEEEDWKDTYTEYVKWQLRLEADREEDPSLAADQQLCPATVWDFALTTDAWFLGDYLLCADFQNHCIGLLYWMNLRFDHLVWDGNLSQDDIHNGFWHRGTVAYVDMKEVLCVWEQTEVTADEQPEVVAYSHPLRKFYRDWLMRYWDSYQRSDWDYEAREGITALVKNCPKLADRVMTGLMGRKELRRKYALEPLAQYWVGAEAYTEAERERDWVFVRGPRSGETPHIQQSMEFDTPLDNWELV